MTKLPRIPHNQWVNRPEYEEAALRVLRSGHVGQGEEVEAFERELTDRFRPGGACAVVSSGTVALRLALSRKNWSAQAFIPTYACSALLHALPPAQKWNALLVDCDPLTFNAAGPCSVFVHTYGVPGNVPADAVEDFTHSPGAYVGQTPCGSLGALSVISFGATKPLGMGAGGAVLGTSDAISDFRKQRDYDTSGAINAFNWQLGDVYAAMGRERLRRLDEENEWRASTAALYDQARPGRRVVAGSVAYRYVIRLKDWTAAQMHFGGMNIETINPLRTDELLHRRMGLPRHYFPDAEDVAATTLSLPIWPGMTREQVCRVADALSALP